MFSHPGWRTVRILAAPLLLWGLFAFVLMEPLQTWLGGDKEYDRAALVEWIEESRVFRATLPEVVRDYVKAMDAARQAEPKDRIHKQMLLKIQAEEIEEYLKALGNPPTKMYANQLPLFPIIYVLEVRFAQEPGSAKIAWDSRLPRHAGPYHELEIPVKELESPYRVRAQVYLRYQLHAYNKQQQNEQVAAQRVRWVAALAVAGTALSLLWMYLMQWREREQEQRRQEAERLHEEAERKLLEQRLEAAQQTERAAAAERQALELKSQLYAGIGIMAGSYAHNIKNLLVRPNDLLARCLEGDGLASEQQHMLREVRHTLGTVTERLQEILRTVRRDPSRAELTRVDLNAVVNDLAQTWKDLAREKWKLSLEVETASEPLLVEADLSHMQQAVENLLFNARDATFEMRNLLREQARRTDGLNEQRVRQAVIEAAGWRGRVVLRTRREGQRGILEVQDNGIGMTDEVRRRCTETHFSTKRDNALYHGNSTGMGLGLSFVTVILEHHKATLTIESELQRGATFRASFPLAQA